MTDCDCIRIAANVMKLENKLVVFDFMTSEIVYFLNYFGQFRNVYKKHKSTENNNHFLSFVSQ